MSILPMMLAAEVLPHSMADVWLNPIDASARALRVRRMIAFFHPLATKDRSDLSYNLSLPQQGVLFKHPRSQ
ncbi:MAG: hypothetical protein ICV54_22390 [Nostoc sp. C3-bin3]|nr:hypothetical protein [Nostoc sp. C3-bin3]